MKKLRKLHVERIRAKLMDADLLSCKTRQWTDGEVRLLLSELDDASTTKANVASAESENAYNESSRELAGEFLRLSIGSHEWESLRSMARDILKRAGGIR
jgi:hypothetical protein